MHRRFDFSLTRIAGNVKVPGLGDARALAAMSLNIVARSLVLPKGADPKDLAAKEC